MTGVPVTRANARHDLEPGLVVDRPEGIERCDGIGLGVDRVDLGSPARRVAPIEGGNLQFLNASGIGQAYRSTGRWCRASPGSGRESLRARASAAGRCGRCVHASAARHRCRPGGTERHHSSVPSASSVPETDRSRPGTVRSGFGRDSKSRSRCGPHRKTERSRSCRSLRGIAVTDFVAQGGCEHAIERDRIGWVRHAVGRTDGANAGANEFFSCVRRKQRMGNDSVDRCGACLDNSAWAQAISVPPDETMSSTSRTGRPGNDRWVGQRDLDRTIAAPSLLRNRVGKLQGGWQVRSPTAGTRRPGRPRRFAGQVRSHEGRLRSPASPRGCRPRCQEKPRGYRPCGADARRP